MPCNIAAFSRNVGFAKDKQCNRAETACRGLAGRRNNSICFAISANICPRERKMARRLLRNLSSASSSRVSSSVCARLFFVIFIHDISQESHRRNFARDTRETPWNLLSTFRQRAKNIEHRADTSCNRLRDIHTCESLHSVFACEITVQSRADGQFPTGITSNSINMYLFIDLSGANLQCKSFWQSVCRLRRRLRLFNNSYPRDG